MGVLDDAIREHLDLKRKHGASEGEVEQQEQEALGAPRREPPPQAEAAAAEPAEQVEPTAEPVALRRFVGMGGRVILSSRRPRP